MKSFHRNILSILIVSTFFSACRPAISVVAQATITPQSTITPTVITMDQIVEAFLSGEYDDVSNLSLEERKEFSILLAQKMNEARGARPLIYNNEAYVDPITGMMKDYVGHPDLSKTIQMYLAVALDEEGNLLVKKEEGTWVKINNSKDMDWDMVIADPDDERIDWPTHVHNNKKDGIPQVKKVVSNGIKYIPVIMLDNQVRQLYMSGVNAIMQATLTFLKIETDDKGIPVIARKIIIWGDEFDLFREGSDFFIFQHVFDIWTYGYAKTVKESQLFNSLKEKQVYYISISSHEQSIIYEGAGLTPINEDYKNVVSIDDAMQVLFNQKSNDLNMLVFPAGLLIEKTR